LGQGWGLHPGHCFTSGFIDLLTRSDSNSLDLTAAGRDEREVVVQSRNNSTACVLRNRCNFFINILLLFWLYWGLNSETY
jgi:hypothetical protein